MTFQATGAALYTALEKTIEYGTALSVAYFPQVSGIRLDYDPRLASGAWILARTVRVGGHLLDGDRLYSVTATESVYNTLISPPLNIPVQDTVTLPDSAFAAAVDLVASRVRLGAASSNRIRNVAAIGNDKHD